MWVLTLLIYKWTARPVPWSHLVFPPNKSQGDVWRKDIVVMWAVPDNISEYACDSGSGCVSKYPDEAQDYILFSSSFVVESHKEIGFSTK